MCPKQRVLTAALVTPLALIGAWALADNTHHDDQAAEHRQHGAHVHGIAALNLALEGQTLQIELDSPAVNIVGFEYAPSSAEDRAALDKTVATLKDGDRLFKLDDDARCRMEFVEVSSELLDGEHEGHVEASAGKHTNEDKERHHDEERDHEGEAHSDIKAAYRFECEAPDKLTALSVWLFGSFSGMEKIEVQYVIESKQGAAELTAKDHVIKF